ncbi:MAG TPA: PEP-CTERM sorting domain-containing protein [Tepidisphaeraceae bacterium]|nr:PEP-CTERM sorting domain-containing protein [Tepidisphaeraceae bacterium]
MLAPAARGALSASASLSTSQASAPFTYTIKLTNTGDLNIASFWFAWTDVPAAYDFLPTAPTNVVAPSGWFAPVVHAFGPPNGYSLEFYVFGNGITPGNTGTFQFTSNDTPAQLGGPAWFGGHTGTDSVIYQGLPQSATSAHIAVAVPEPASLTLGGVGGMLLLMRRRRTVGR